MTSVATPTSLYTTVCSIHFMEVENTQPYKPQFGPGGWRTTFTFPAQKRGEHFVHHIPPFYQNTHMHGGTAYIDAPYDSRQWAQTIVEAFTTNHVHSLYGSPGVFICAGEEPTEQELAIARDSQGNWARKLVLEAQDFWAAGQKLAVSDLHRRAAEWLGDTNYEWMRPPQDVKNVPCPLCGRLVEDSALQCPHCMNVMDTGKWLSVKLQQAELQAKLRDMLKARGLDPDMAPAPPPPPAPKPKGN